MATSKTNISKIDKYVKGRLNVRDRHELERETYNDAFLDEAIEGFEDFADYDHEETIGDLKTQLAARVAPAKNKPLLLWRMLPVAASVILILGVGYWFLKPTDNEIHSKKYISKVKSSMPATINKADGVKTEPTGQSVKQNRKLVADRIKGPSAIYKTDTVEYIASDYKVRANATVGEMLKKAEGFEIDTTGAILFQGQPVANVRLNGKDYLGGDVNKAIRSLPADIIDKLQVVDDYGDQAGRTGIKTGDPNKVLNLTTTKGNPLNEVVVVGYGTQKKSALVGSVNNLPAVSAPLSEKTASEPNKALNLSVKPARNTDTMQYSGVEVLTDTATLPKPVNGWRNFKSYIHDNALNSDGLSGEVIVAFYVNVSGEITLLNIIKGDNAAINKKVRTIIANGPKWKGATITREVRLKIFFYKK